MPWSLEPGTFDLVHSEGRSDFTAAEFAWQEWPPCPACGTRVIVDAIPTPSLENRDSFLPGRARCPRGHTPHEGLDND